jgi:uncharacterized membrane protein
MAPVAIVFGMLLILLGLGGFVYGLTTPGEPARKLTALIPAGVGLLLLVLGVLARRENRRKHAMHLAALFGLLGLLGGIARLAFVAASGNFEWSAPTVSATLMALLCGVFVGLCIKSFIHARRAQAKAASS